MKVDKPDMERYARRQRISHILFWIFYVWTGWSIYFDDLPNDAVWGGIRLLYPLSVAFVADWIETGKQWFPCNDVFPEKVSFARFCLLFFPSVAALLNHFMVCFIGIGKIGILIFHWIGK